MLPHVQTKTRLTRRDSTNYMYEKKPRTFKRKNAWLKGVMTYGKRVVI